MNTTPPFAMLIDLAQKEVDEAAIKLGTLQRRRDEMLGQRNDLNGYRSEYEDKLASAARGGMTMAERRNFDMFLGTLGTAIDQQQHQVVVLDRALAAARVQWQAKQQKLRSFEALESRSNVALARQAQQRDQRQTDEFAARRSRDAKENV